MDTDNSTIDDLMDPERRTLDMLFVIICSRPRMFAYDGKFETCATFIDGFVRGAGPPLYEDLEKFRDWLAQECYKLYRLPRNYGWWYCRRLFPDDAEALEWLPKLLQCFRQGQKLRKILPPLNPPDW